MTTLKNTSDADWMDSKAVAAVFGLNKQKLYRLLQENKIHSVSSVNVGASRGKRLWNVDSIKEYLNSLGDGFTDQGNQSYQYNHTHRFSVPTFCFKPSRTFALIKLD